MTLLQFQEFARNSRITTHAAVDSISELDLIFIRAARAPPQTAALAEAVESSGVCVGKIPTKGKGKKAGKGVGINDAAQQLKGAGHLLSQTQFIGGLLRLATAIYADDRSTPTAGDKLTRLINEHVHGHVYDELRLIKDDFDEVMRSRTMGAVLDRHATLLLQTFRSFAAADVPDGAGVKAMAETMNLREMHELCESCRVYDDVFTPMDLIAIFVKCNIDDELYVQEEVGNNSGELVFDEFEVSSDPGPLARPLLEPAKFPQCLDARCVRQCV